VSTGPEIAAVSANASFIASFRHPRAEALLGELSQAGDIADALGERLQAFGHSLYRDGDPRAAAILGALPTAVTAARSAFVAEAAAAAEHLLARKPNVDFALAAVSVTLRLPRGAAIGMFLVARAVGWIAYAMEQYAAGQLIRPRARYIGALPGSE
jgi:citrate synthase